MTSIKRKPSVPDLILELRSGYLCQQLGYDKPENRMAYMAWLVAHGVREYPALLNDEEFISTVMAKESQDGVTGLQQLVWIARPDVQSVFPQPAKRNEFNQWFYTRGVKEMGLWPLLGDGERNYLLQREPWKTEFAGADPAMIGAELGEQSPISVADRPFGINIIGYAFGQLGIGEDARMAARALKAVGVPFTMLDFPPGDNIPQNDRSMEAHVSEDGPYAFNLFCMTAMETARYYVERGPQQLQGRYNIGYWPWELGRWPREWESIAHLMDEVWVSTRHIYDALAPVCPVPVLVMPMAVELGKVARRTRKDFGLPPKAVLFAFSFDLNSYVHRKNPQACLEAFVRAFPRRGVDKLGREQVGLVIKTHVPKRPNKAWKDLKDLAAKDDRIHIVEDTLDRPELLALYKSCDCFLSLHRAEGFGRGIAECMQLGLHVITTGYSGNLDFCQPPEADLVDYSMIWVGKNEYPYGEGQVWAEPDVNHAADLMRNFVASGRDAPQRKEWPEFSPKVVGDHYQQRLEKIVSWKDVS